MRRETRTSRGRGREGRPGIREVLARVVGVMLGRGASYRAGEYPRAGWPQLRRRGLTREQVWELAERGLVEQSGGAAGRVELTREGLAEGVGLLRGGAVRGAGEVARRGRRARKGPAWRDGELRFDGVLVKQYAREAENQSLVLDTFERGKWARSVGNPLPAVPGVNRKLELRRTVEALNDRQAVPLIRFHAEGGERVRWERMI